MMRLLSAQHVHIIGIGGSGMSPLAAILLAMGKRVSGSDLYLSAVTAGLVAQGATIYEGHRAENIAGAELIVITSAAREDNPEIQQARLTNVPVVKGSQLLGALMDERTGIAIAGTHGKTTTTAMVTLILERAGLDPSFVVGGIVRDLGVSGKLGRGRYLVAEADEYDERFLQLKPHIAVITNIEGDHLDFYKNMSNLTHAFEQFVRGITPGGWLVACGDNALARQMGEVRSLDSLGGLRELHKMRGNSLLYGLGDNLDYQATELAVNDAGGFDFSVVHGGDLVGRFHLIVPGQHNVQNAVAAITVAQLVGVPVAVTQGALAEFRGAERRFEVKGEAQIVTVVDDYAHHPTEIKATLAAARSRYAGRRIVAVHQPHTYSRLLNLLPEFASAFGDADIVLICDIYASRETDTLGMHSQKLVSAMTHPGVHYAGGLDEAAAMLKGLLLPGDVLITLGAGDVNQVGREILALTSSPETGTER